MSIAASSEPILRSINVRMVLYRFVKHFTSLVTVKDPYTHFVYTSIYMKYQICENFDSIGHRSCKRIMEKKTPLLHNIVGVLSLRCLQKASGLESFLLFEWQITSFSQNAVSHSVVYILPMPQYREYVIVLSYYQ